MLLIKSMSLRFISVCVYNNQEIDTFFTTNNRVSVVDFYCEKFISKIFLSFIYLWFLMFLYKDTHSHQAKFSVLSLLTIFRLIQLWIRHKFCALVRSWNILFAFVCVFFSFNFILICVHSNIYYLVHKHF